MPWRHDGDTRGASPKWRKKLQQLYDADNRQLAIAAQWMAWTNERLEPPLHVLVMEITRLTPAERGRCSGASCARRPGARPPLKGMVTYHHHMRT